MKRPSEAQGALAGLIVSAPLTAIFLLTATLGLPDTVSDLFYFLRDSLPGNLLPIGVQILKNSLLMLGFSLIETAKTAEQVMGVGMFLGALVVAVAVYFFVTRWRGLRPDYRGGLTLGLAVGAPMMLIVNAKDINASASMAVSAMWTLIAFAGWGALVQWIHQRLDTPDPASGQAMSVEQIDRRRFLIRAGASSAAITVVGAGLNAALATSLAKAPPVAQGGDSATAAVGPKDLPNMDAELKPAPGTRPEYTPLEDHYRIDITLNYPRVAEAGWTLPISGLVDKPLNLTLAQLKTYPKMEQFVTLACISNEVGGELIGTTKWTGVSVQKVLADAGVKTEALYMALEAADGFFETVSLETIAKDERVMFTYAWDDQPLLEEHGFPLRIYIPDRYGMKQPKWITQAKIVAEYNEGYWVRRGWDEVARMNATSVIDTVAVDSPVKDAQGQTLIPVGGIAHAGARSVSKVEVKVDDGPWTAAALRKPLSTTTWVIWRFDWPMQPGNHTFYVRCVDGQGVPQDERVAGVLPSGATGIDSMRANVGG